MTSEELRQQKTVKLTITMPKGLSDDLSRYCKAWDYQLSECIREAVRRMIN